MTTLSTHKTLIAVLASHDSDERNASLARVFDQLVAQSVDRLRKFHFLFTGGTFRRVVLGDPDRPRITPVAPATRELLLENCTCLPSREEGGVTVLSYLIVRRLCSAIWPFFTPLTAHWLTPENLALMRLCDLWHVKRLMNSGSVQEWFDREGDTDADRNPQLLPLSLVLDSDGTRFEAQCSDNGPWRILRPPQRPVPSTVGEMTIALIAHDDMKGRMVDFAIDYERELAAFRRVLATGTTGRDVGDAATKLDRIYRYHSGPKGGDIEIATEVLMGHCDVVVFFVDPLHPHPHIEDIRVVFGACMIQDNVRMLTNELQAREWMGRVARKQLRAG